MQIIDGAVVRNIPWPGCIGDSMRETANLHCMLRKLEERNIHFREPDILKKINLTQFRTSDGYLRHKDAPDKGIPIAPAGYINAGERILVKDSWREKDTSGDQYILWFREIGHQVPIGKDLQKEMRSRVIKNLMRYGNGDLIHPGFFAEIVNWDWLRKQNLNTQVDLFEQKYRYNDELNKFEPNENSSADYWVWSAIACDFSKKWPANRVGADILKNKFAHYLRDEPDHQWYLDIACLFADTFFV